MQKDFIKFKVEEFLAKQYYCGLEELNGKETFFSIHTDTQQPYIKILAYRSCVIVCTSKDLHEKIKALLIGKCRDEIFELPYVYGQTIHYIPDRASQNNRFILSDYECEFLFEKEIFTLRGLRGFGNSLEFDENGSTPAQAVCIAKDKGKIIGAAGASLSSVDGMWELGVDVMEEYRNARLGTYLISRLTNELTAKSIVPFYSASVTNIGSQMVAARCGYIPAWVDTFGTILDGSSVYDSIVSGLQ